MWPLHRHKAIPWLPKYVHQTFFFWKEKYAQIYYISLTRSLRVSFNFSACSILIYLFFFSGRIFAFPFPCSTVCEHHSIRIHFVFFLLFDFLSGNVFVFVSSFIFVRTTTDSNIWCWCTIQWKISSDSTTTTRIFTKCSSSCSYARSTGMDMSPTFFSLSLFRRITIKWTKTKWYLVIVKTKTKNRSQNIQQQ